MVEVKGPITKFKYVPNTKKHIAMLCGGSGITPMLQVASFFILRLRMALKYFFPFAPHFPY